MREYDWDASIALAIMQAESGCNPSAHNPANFDGSNDSGLFQINSIHVTSGLISEEARRDPLQNIKAAYAIYQGGGWSAWSAYNNGAYRKFL